MLWGREGAADLRVLGYRNALGNQGFKAPGALYLRSWPASKQPKALSSDSDPG